MTARARETLVGIKGADVTQRDDLPEDPDPGEYRCPECGHGVTVSSSGTEYGHGLGGASGHTTTCPRRREHGPGHRVGGGRA